MTEDLKKLLNLKNLLIITVSLIIFYILCNIFLYENFSARSSSNRRSRKRKPRAPKVPIPAPATPPQIIPQIPEIWVVDANNNIVKGELSKDSMLLTTIPGNKKFKQVSAGEFDVWAIGTTGGNGGEIYRCAKPCDKGEWQLVDGGLEQVNVGKNGVLGFNSSNDTWFRKNTKESPYTNSSWYKVGNFNNNI